MAEYQKSTVSGAWVKAKDVVSGTKCKLVTETVPSEGSFEGKTIKNNVAKIRFQGQEGEAKNVNVNKPSINGLVDAFGTDSKGWIGKLLTAQTEKMIVGGKRVTGLYLIPEGYELGEDSGGYLVVTKIGAAKNPVTGVDQSEEDGQDGVPYPDEINPDDIPF